MKWAVLNVDSNDAKLSKVLVFQGYYKNAHLSASSGRSSSKGKKAPSSAFRPPLSLCCMRTAVNSLVAAVKASS